MQAVFTLVSVMVLAIHTADGFGWGGPLGLGPGIGGFGGSCGCAPPVCAPPPPPVCALPPPPPCQPACPPPPPPPQTFCPPPQACPVCPPPPQPYCPPPPPPPPCPPPPQPYCPPPPPPPPPQPTCNQPYAQNDCCSGCDSPCRFRSRKMFGAVIAERNVDPKCNNGKLRDIMLENMTDDISSSKRAIQKAAQDKLQGKFDVICAKGEFSYVVNSNFFCQQTLGEVNCYAFRH